jgi:hypothetical protein
MDLVPFVIAVLVLVGLDLAALRWGVSSQPDGHDRRDHRRDWW